MDRLFLEKTDSWTILNQILKSERADELIVCSFAMAEGFVRRLIKEKSRIGKLTVILDFTIATRNRANMLFIANNTDELYLTNTHAKLFYIKNENKKVVAALSANATMNYRYECGIVTENEEMVLEAEKCIGKMISDGKRIKFD
jgi:hypothetical protein